MEGLIAEFRRDYQIPPYFSDAGLEQYCKEGIAAFHRLNPGCDYEKDLEYRNLLKCYMYYSYHHVIAEFWENYRSAILGWQLGTEADEQ